MKKKLLEMEMYLTGCFNRKVHRSEAVVCQTIMDMEVIIDWIGRRGSVMANSMCQLDWPEACPESW